MNSIEAGYGTVNGLLRTSPDTRGGHDNGSTQADDSLGTRPLQTWRSWPQQQGARNSASFTAAMIRAPLLRQLRLPHYPTRFGKTSARNQP